MDVTEMPINPRSRTAIVLMMLISSMLTFQGPSEAEESSRVLEWSPPFQLTMDMKNSTSPDIAIDSENNINIVFMKDLGNITYKKIGPNNKTIVNDTTIANSTAGRLAMPKIALGPSNEIHLTWQYDSTSQPAITMFRYMKLNPSLGVMLDRSDQGGDDILVDDDGNPHVYRYARYPVGFVGPEYDVITYSKLDLIGEPFFNRTVGVHKASFKAIDFALDPQGGANFVFQHNQTTLNFTRFDTDGTKMVDQVPLAIATPPIIEGGYDISIVVEEDSDVNVVHIMGSTERIGFLKVNSTGVEQVGDTEIWHSQGTEWADTVWIVGPDGSGNYVVVFSGEGEMSNGDLVQSLEIDDQGVVITSPTYVASYCPWDGGEASPSLAMDPNGVTHMVYRSNTCDWMWLDRPTDLFYRFTPYVEFIDLAIKEGEIKVDTDPVTVGQEFVVNTTVRNLGNIDAETFNVNLTFSNNGTLIKKVNMTLEAMGYQNLSFNVTLFESANLTLTVDPLSNIDINTSNNVVNFTVNVSAPDLWVTADGISFSDPRPYVTDEINISALVQNSGDIAGWADVELYDGEGGALIGTKSISLDPSISSFVNFTWAPDTSGTRKVVVNVTNVTPAERAATLFNNSAWKEITVLENFPPDIRIMDPWDGKGLTPEVHRIVGSVLDVEKDDIEIDVRVDGGVWAPANVASVNWDIEWNFTGYSEGPHIIEARARDGYNEVTTSVNINISVPPPQQAIWITDQDPGYSITMYEGETVNFTVEYGSIIDCMATFTWKLDDLEIPTSINTLSYFADYEDAGLHILTVWVHCGDVGAWTGWNITVIDVNRKPVITHQRPETMTVHMNTTFKMQFNVTAYDPDGDNLTYIWSVEGVEVSKAGPLYMFGPTTNGSFSVGLNVSDGRGGYTLRYWQVFVDRPAKPPVGPGTTSVEGGWGWILLAIIIICIVVLFAVRYHQLSDKTGQKGAGRARTGPGKERGGTEEDLDMDDDGEVGPIDEDDEAYLED